MFFASYLFVFVFLILSKDILSTIAMVSYILCMIQHKSWIHRTPSSVAVIKRFIPVYVGIHERKNSFPCMLASLKKKKKEKKEETCPFSVYIGNKKIIQTKRTTYTIPNQWRIQGLALLAQVSPLCPEI